MALGYGPSQHRKRSKSYAASTAMGINAIHKYLSKGNCIAARSALVEASITAGAAYAEDSDIGRKKRRSISSHPSIKSVREAKKLLMKKCPMKFKKGRGK